MSDGASGDGEQRAAKASGTDESGEVQQDSGDQRDAGAVFREDVDGAAQRAGYDKFADDSTPTGKALLAAMGGIRGMVEAVLPGLVFVVTYVLSNQLPLTLALSVGTAAVFTVWRLVGRTPVVSAIGGLAGVALSAVFALATGRAEDNFIPGFIINVVSFAIMLGSVLARWPVVGVIVGFLDGSGNAWRAQPRRRRLYSLLTLGWAGLFLLRLAVQFPLWLAENVAALGIAKLLMGLPLYAPALILTWLVVRASLRKDAKAAPAE